MILERGQDSSEKGWNTFGILGKILDKSRFEKDSIYDVDPQIP